MIVKAAVKQGERSLLHLNLCSKLNFYRQGEVLSPQEEPSRCLDGEDGPRFAGLKKYNNDIYRDEAVNTTPNTAD